MKRTLAKTGRIVALAMATCGFRFDRLPTVFAGSCAVAFALLIQRNGSARAAILYFSATWVFYCVGNTIALASRGRPVANRARAEREYAVYESLLAFAFVNQTASLSCLAILPGRISDQVTPLFCCVLGGLLFATGYIVKLWSAALVGVGTYYFRDLFLGLRSDTLVTTGPYRFFKNPMYGVGNLHAYGYALLVDSVPVLIGAACLQAGVYAFYFVVERSFMARMYASST